MQNMDNKKLVPCIYNVNLGRNTDNNGIDLDINSLRNKVLYLILTHFSYIYSIDVI